MVFTVPAAAESADGWGPAAIEVAELAEFAPIYAPFNKTDRLGCAADWTQTGFGKFGGSACPVRLALRSHGSFSRLVRVVRARESAGAARGRRRLAQP